MKIPIPYPHVNDMPDRQLVPKIQQMVPLETAEFFYGKAAPIFIKLYNGYYTDCRNTVEFINAFYVDLMSVRPKAQTRKIDGFAYKCMFKNWIGKLALMYCYGMYKMKKGVEESSNDETNAVVDQQVEENMKSLDRQDVDNLLSMMTCKNYRDLIRMVYLDEMSLEETADAMGLSLANFYNMHRRAKLQYLQVYQKEMSI